MEALLHELDQFVYVPMTRAASRLVVAFVANRFFGEIAFNSVPRAFIKLGCYFGVIHLFFLVSFELFLFSISTIMIFAACFCIALLLKKMLKWDVQKTLKILILIYSWFCFRIHTERGDFDEFILIFVILAIKLLCAAETLEKKATFKLPKVFVLVSYLCYLPWITFTDFVQLFDKRNQVNQDWWRMVTSAASRVILYKLMSFKMIDYDIVGDFLLKPQIFSILRAAQFRTKYYYTAQVVEFEILALGLKKFEWLRHSVFDFHVAEFSILIKDCFLNLNIPLTTYIRDKIAAAKDKRVVLFHVLAIIFIVATYNIRYSVLWMLVLGSMYLQEKALHALASYYDICLFTCPTPFCYHNFGSRKYSYCFLYSVLVVHNQFRISILFVSPTTVNFMSSFTCTLFAIAIDMVIILLMSMKRKTGEFHYFRYLKKD
ncbi:uncharacterized protein LOC103313026 [Tribolium castaneum]|uniref:Uncharacterized protein n=1 Tax=Tribolium castaneum TaxID=7070 RepID=D6W6V2_TRICA|nr:PREDICTED: uncharacterized protein LOC103313026 [Tribolium castaneum]EFA11451.2 hypothetical protein TcasGA2_TC013636 [Tribolium castaneum]|eukprot:XP_008193386.1 PREDICTED: uncharacterized protein LOC103313026 [Tribolium castaneum]